jgi:hypothetical protein
MVNNCHDIIPYQSRHLHSVFYFSSKKPETKSLCSYCYFFSQSSSSVTSALATNNTSFDSQNRDDVVGAGGPGWKRASSSIENLDTDGDEYDSEDHDESPDGHNQDPGYNRQQSEPGSGDATRGASAGLAFDLQQTPRVRPTSNLTDATDLRTSEIRNRKCCIQSKDRDSFNKKKKKKKSREKFPMTSSTALYQ